MPLGPNGTWVAHAFAILFACHLVGIYRSVGGVSLRTWILCRASIVWCPPATLFRRNIKSHTLPGWILPPKKSRFISKEGNPVPNFITSRRGVFFKKHHRRLRGVNRFKLLSRPAVAADNSLCGGGFAFLCDNAALKEKIDGRYFVAWPPRQRKGSRAFETTVGQEVHEISKRVVGSIR